ncbi:MAG: hypothetical protein JEY99_07200, partial [Spirochaetales bacterium]|nr:hypothetical protein [Spirochaetales bacterium]
MEIPCCPNPKCTHFHNPDKDFWYVKYGTYRSRAFGTVHRYRCKACG